MSIKAHESYPFARCNAAISAKISWHLSNTIIDLYIGILSCINIRLIYIYKIDLYWPLFTQNRYSSYMYSELFKFYGGHCNYYSWNRPLTLSSSRISPIPSFFWAPILFSSNTCFLNIVRHRLSNISGSAKIFENAKALNGSISASEGIETNFWGHLNV